MMADATELLAQVTEPGEAGALRVDLNDFDSYVWDSASTLGRKGTRRSTLEAANVDGATVAARSRPMMQARFVIHIVPQDSLADLVAAYEELQQAMEDPFTLKFALPGWDPEDPFFIDFDSYDDFPNLVDGTLAWVPGCDESWLAMTLDITALRHPRSYGAGDFL
jgi:hypothetical protein